MLYNYTLYRRWRKIVIRGDTYYPELSEDIFFVAQFGFFWFVAKKASSLTLTPFAGHRVTSPEIEASTVPIAYDGYEHSMDVDTIAGGEYCIPFRVWFFGLAEGESWAFCTMGTK
jgi:hypothetical protein